jgi:polyphosphate kinase
VFVGSADWVPRNFFRRIEVVFPIEDGNLRERLISEILGVTLADNAMARILDADGIYRHAEIPAGKTPRRSQMEFIALAAPQIVSKTKGKFPRVKIRTATSQN